MTKFLIGSFTLWRISTLLFFSIGISFLTIQQGYLGGGEDIFPLNPVLWSFGNFDGGHYQYISVNGYEKLEYFFFPAYPLLMRLISSILGGGLLKSHMAGIAISNMSFVIALIGLWKLLRIDFSKEFTRLVIFLLILFPTSFYFGAVYTESLFLAAVSWSYYFFRKDKWVYAGLLGAIASATRSVGILLLLSYLVEIFWRRREFVKKPEELIKSLFGTSLIMLGIGSYMFFLYKSTGNPFAFNENGFIFGEYRSAQPVLLPQVFYRYIFRIIPNLTWSYFPQVYVVFLELFSSIMLLIAAIFGIKMLRPGYWIYMVGGYIAPTLFLSFVSLPRYILVLFPFYILFAKFMQTLSTPVKWTVIVFMIILLGISSALFSAGYWVA